MGRVRGLTGRCMVRGVSLSVRFRAESRTRRLCKFMLCRKNVIPNGVVHIIGVPKVSIRTYTNARILEANIMKPVGVGGAREIRSNMREVSFSTNLTTVSSVRRSNRLLERDSAVFGISGSRLPGAYSEFFDR